MIASLGTRRGYSATLLGISIISKAGVCLMLFVSEADFASVFNLAIESIHCGCVRPVQYLGCCHIKLLFSLVH
jgi:hypothetical protein